VLYVTTQDKIKIIQSYGFAVRKEYATTYFPANKTDDLDEGEVYAVYFEGKQHCKPASMTTRHQWLDAVYENILQDKLRELLFPCLDRPSLYIPQNSNTVP
jgi:hypothetical protein